MTHFPVDAIDQIDDIGGRLRISLSTGVKIDLDPIEGERVLKQVEAMNVARQPEAVSSSTILARMSALEARVMSLQSSLLALEASRGRPKVKSNA